ncbi:hypothetical protein C8J27_10899 [Rhodobacter aestuarii]|uniref:Uncharacterized protein n=1 Tax=Rhodobacter aestuarii TaxID=453582 RepID=A0A1N7PJT1_9RHOB|nr:hypothetical protein [Rhodobacter aestuarii]PTV94364.1 hypothetical protein C8J27_10899 [Rhodobacter aestuarii]SIT10826.1 hypothetical protein SAMN05421580_11062 [Rhodobacter aestuarii]
MDTVFPEILAEIDAGLEGRAELPSPDALLKRAEEILEAWLAARGEVPEAGEVEGFRLLALHRQGCKGTPSFNACRETCREIVFRRNVTLEYGEDTVTAHRLEAMVVKHLALFVGGKLEQTGLGEFCCSSRPLHAGVA